MPDAATVLDPSSLAGMPFAQPLLLPPPDTPPLVAPLALPLPAAKTNFPIQNYLGGGSAAAGGRDTSAAVAAESPKAPGGADVPGRRRSSHAGDASAKASQAQHSELSWGALGLSRSARLSQDASEGAPRWVVLST